MELNEIAQMLVSDYAIILYEIIILTILLIFIVKLSRKHKKCIQKQELARVKTKEDSLKKILTNDKRG